MDENSTTDATDNDTGVSEDTQPEEAVETEAEVETNDATSQEAPQGDEPPAEESSEETEAEDNSTAEWLKKKGVDPKSPEAIEKVAEMARNAEKAMHAKAAKASALEKASQITDDQVPADATPEVRDSVRTRNLELRLDIQDWKMRNPDKVVHEAEMVKVLTDPTKKALVQDGYLSLDDVYSIARGGNTEAAKSQGKKEALESLAQKQTAAVPKGNAVTSVNSPTRITSENVDELIAANDQKWFESNYEAINKALSA